MSDDEGWARWGQLPVYRVTQIPRVPAAPADDSRESSAPRIPADHGLGQRVATLAAACHDSRQEPIAFGWVRPESTGPVTIAVVGSALVGSAPAGSSTSDEVLLVLPSGARARPAGTVASLMDSLLAWQPICGIWVGTPARDQPRRYPATSLDDVLLGSWTAPFGWMVFAEPVPATTLTELRDQTVARLHLIEGTADRFPDRALEADRLRRRLAELRRGQSAGLWRTHVFVGGNDGSQALRVAGLLCASIDLTELPYALVPTASPPDEPLVASTDLVAALTCPPQAEIPGIRLVSRPSFDTTPDLDIGTQSRGVMLGEILDRNRVGAGAFRLPEASLNRHVFVTGATGAGKSQTIRTLLEHSTVPWLVIEPAKAEYRRMANRVRASVIRIRPGEPDAIPAGINPLEPAAGFPLQTHADMVRALFVASFRSEEPFPQVLSAALTLAYTQAGWDLVLGESSRAAGRPEYPTLATVQRAARQVVTEIGYSQRVTDDVLGFMNVRLSSLRHGTTGRFLAGGHPVDFGALLRSNAVLEIEDIGDDRDKAFLMGTVLIRLAEHLRMAGERDRLVHLTVVEEAHRLLRRPREDGAAAHAVELFAGMLAELRSYGEGLIVADQIPARLVPDVIKNTAVKIAHRLPAADDREAVGATMNLTPAQSRYLVTLAPGDAVVFADGMDNPMLVSVPDSTQRERTGPSSTAAITAVVGRRSRTCGHECLAVPCTLREMRGAQRLCQDQPWLRIWAELTVLAHLAGWPMPVPKASVLAGLRSVGSRLRDCALSQAVGEAVSARLPMLPAELDEGALAAHACQALAARTVNDVWLCEPQEPRWMVTDVPSGAVLGVDNPSVLEQALGARRDAEGFSSQLTDALRDFTDCRWPLSYLITDCPQELSTSMCTT